MAPYDNAKPKASGRGGNSPPANATNNGRTTGLRKSNDQRADVLKTPTHPNRYPKGMA